MDQAVQSGSLLALRLVVELSRQLAAALATIHGKGIIHRARNPN